MIEKLIGFGLIRVKELILERFIIFFKMLSRFRFWGKPIVPLLIINSSLNQEKAANFLKQLERIDYSRAQAVAMVIEINNHMPVQIDKIS